MPEQPLKHCRSPKGLRQNCLRLHRYLLPSGNVSLTTFNLTARRSKYIIRSYKSKLMYISFLFYHNERIMSSKNSSDPHSLKQRFDRCRMLQISAANSETEKYRLWQDPETVLAARRPRLSIPNALDVPHGCEAEKYRLAQSSRRYSPRGAPRCLELTL